MHRATGWVEEKGVVTRAKRPAERVRACDSLTLLRTHRFESGRLIPPRRITGRGNFLSQRCGEMTWKIGINAPLIRCTLFSFLSIFAFLSFSHFNSLHLHYEYHHYNYYHKSGCNIHIIVSSKFMNYNMSFISLSNILVRFT